MPDLSQVFKCKNNITGLFFSLFLSLYYLPEFGTDGLKHSLCMLGRTNLIVVDVCMACLLLPRDPAVMPVGWFLLLLEGIGLFQIAGVG